MADDVKGVTVKPAKAPKRAKGSFFRRSLSIRLLVLTIIVVSLAEFLILAPQLAMFHRNWLQDRVNAAQIAALALEAAPDADVTASLKQKLLENAEVSRVALKRSGSRELRLDAPMPGPPRAMRTFDLRNKMMAMAIYDAFDTLFGPSGRQMRVLATPRFETGEFIEIVIAEAPLKREMEAYAWQMLRASLIVTMLNGLLLYIVLNAMFVRPMRRLTEHIERFREHPEDVSIALKPSGRVDEIGRAERALSDMEAQVRLALRQRERLAALGAAVAKLAHDLRNSLSTASLVTERLAQSDDAGVRQSAPRLERAVSRAAGLAEAALRYGRADEPAPRLESVPLAAALNEAADDALAAFPQIEWINSAPVDLAVTADADHLHRIATNLMRNAAHAMAAAEGGRIEARANRRGDNVIVEIADNGPGLAAAAQARLFEPFSSGNGGAGLGLTIARELARTLGGDLQLVSSGVNGVVFAITLHCATALAGARS